MCAQVAEFKQRLGRAKKQVLGLKRQLAEAVQQRDEALAQLATAPLDPMTLPDGGSDPAAAPSRDSEAIKPDAAARDDTDVALALQAAAAAEKAALESVAVAHTAQAAAGVEIAAAAEAKVAAEAAAAAAKAEAASLQEVADALRAQVPTGEPPAVRNTTLHPCFSASRAHSSPSPNQHHVQSHNEHVTIDSTGKSFTLCDVVKEGLTAVCVWWIGTGGCCRGAGSCRAVRGL